MSFIESFRRYRRSYSNYLNVMYNVTKKRPIIMVKLRDGQTYNLHLSEVRMAASILQGVHITNFNFIDESNGGAIKFVYKGKSLCFSNAQVGAMADVFGKEFYKFLDVENENVIDIGANIGDSTIYFAVNNAKKVIALEPYPSTYNLVLENIRTNKLENNITLLNAGYGQDGMIKVQTDLQNTFGRNLKSSDEGAEIRVISLKTLLKEYDYEKPVLKMNCVGCECNIVNEDNNTLRQFKRIQIHYNYGYEKIKNKLEEVGFTVKYTEPIKMYAKYATTPNMSMGEIYAKLHDDS